MSPQRFLSRSTAFLGAVALVACAPAQAQQSAPIPAVQPGGAITVKKPLSGVRADLMLDVQGVEKKFNSLADAMKGKYSWRPAPGVRSVGEVFGHVAGESFVLPTVVGAAAPADWHAADMNVMFGKVEALEKQTDEAKTRAELARSFTHLKAAIENMPDEQLDGMVKFFGMDASRRGVMIMIVSHMHEHLGQAIAYARMGGVTPPWSMPGATGGQ